MKQKKLIVIVGPTAIGKTNLSIQLAHELKCVIFSADSRQFFKEMAIGTAKPTANEMEGIPHFFIDCKSITERYSAGQFESDALIELDKQFKISDHVILVGGSGLYVDALCYGMDDIPSDVAVRDQLNQTLANFGLGVLQEELKSLDPVTYNEINLKNPQRVIRALEVCRVTGQPYAILKKRKKKTRPFEIIVFGLEADRSTVYERINLRVELMFNTGLLDEVRTLLPYRNLNALNTVGYKELFKYIDGEIDFNEAKEEIKKNTRNFAKRQFTWFNKNKDINWLNAFDKNNLKTIISRLQNS